MANIEVASRSSPKQIGITDQPVLTRNDGAVKGVRQHPSALAQPRFLPLVLTLVRLWLLCWYPEGFVVKSRHE